MIRSISLMVRVMYNLYDYLKLKIDNKDFSNKNLIHSLEVIEIIKKLKSHFIERMKEYFCE